MSFTLAGRTYGVSFVGDCDIDFTDPMSGSSLDCNVFGSVDTLTRPYKVRLDKKTRVQGQLGRLKAKKDFEYVGLTLYSWTVREEGPWAVFSVVFKGCVDNVTPNPKLSGGFSDETITLTYEGGAAPVAGLIGTTVDVLYKAPWQTIRYVSKSIPNKPLFKRLPIGSIDIETVTGAAEGDVFIASVRESERILNSNIPIITGGAFRAGQILKVDGPQYEQVGTVYECSETYKLQLRPLIQFGRLTS